MFITIYFGLMPKYINKSNSSLESIFVMASANAEKATVGCFCCHDGSYNICWVFDNGHAFLGTLRC